MILDSDSDGILTFSEYYDLFRYATMFNRFTSNNVQYGHITSTGIRENIDSMKHMTSIDDISKLESLINLTEGRKFSFKHFLIYMRADSIFKRFTQLNGDTSVTLEDLETGMNQLNLPTLKGIAKLSKHGYDFRDRPLFE